jgi:hypothetical protein
VIINIRGTSGAGKSHLVRLAMQLGRCRPWFDGENDGRGDLLGPREQVGYVLSAPIGPVAILGRYDVPSGGCDDLMKRGGGYTRDQMYELIRSQADGYHVLYEGLLIAEVNRLVALQRDGHQVKVLHLCPPIEECIAAIYQRRAEKGNTAPLNETATRSKERELRRQTERIIAAGIEVSVCSSREAARGRLMEWLGCPV